MNEEPPEAVVRRVANSAQSFPKTNLIPKVPFGKPSRHQTWSQIAARHDECGNVESVRSHKKSLLLQQLAVLAFYAVSTCFVLLIETRRRVLSRQLKRAGQVLLMPTLRSINVAGTKHSLTPVLDKCTGSTIDRAHRETLGTPWDFWDRGYVVVASRKGIHQPLPDLGQTLLEARHTHGRSNACNLAGLINRSVIYGGPS